MEASERQDWIDYLEFKIAQIRGGRRMVPIHEVRTHATAMGLGRADFDAILMGMDVELRAISDLRNATHEQLADSIRGVNETLFYIV